MTQPTEPPVQGCPANRLNTYGGEHPRHRCTVHGTPHPTRPHLCDCGRVWRGVGEARCAYCHQPKPSADLVIVSNSYRCAAACRSIGRPPAQSQSAGLVLANAHTPPVVSTGPRAAGVSGAATIVADLLNVCEQHRPGDPPPWHMFAHGLAIIQRALQQTPASPPPYIRQPGDPVRHGMVIGP